MFSSCKVLAAYSPEKRPFPWSIPSSGQVVAMEMPTEDRLLILNRQAVLFSVPFASAVAGEATFTSLKPMNIKVGAVILRFKKLSAPGKC